MRCLCTARVEGTLLQYTHDRADCQSVRSVSAGSRHGMSDGRSSHNVQETCSLLGRYLRCFCVDAHEKMDGRVEPVGYSESDWAGDAGSWKSQCSGKILADWSSSELVLEATVGDRHGNSGVPRITGCGTPQSPGSLPVSKPTSRSNSSPPRQRGSPTVKESVGRVRSLEVRVLWGLSKQFDGQHRHS